MKLLRVLAFAGVLLTAVLAVGARGGFGFRLINGNPVPAGTHKEVVALKFSDGTQCTGTVVGAKAVITAASCASESTTATFTLDGSSYSASFTLSDLFTKEEHDIALGLMDKSTTIKPANVGGTAAEGNPITLMGYGCTKEDGTGGNNGQLLMGETVLTRLNNHSMISQKKEGAILCFGDSGGPAFQNASGSEVLLGVNSRGNLLNTNYSTRLDLAASKDFLKSWGDQNSANICGIHVNCTGGANAPTCNLAAAPNPVAINNPVTLTLTVQGQATSATINGVAVAATGGALTVTPSQAGTAQATGQVTGAGGTNTCQTSYVVTGDPGPAAPSCELSAIPDKIKLGEQIILTIRTKGEVTQAYIDGQQVTPPEDSRTIKPTQKGVHEATGWVVGPKGTAQCKKTYTVDDGSVQPVPQLAVIPTYCGKNTLTETDVDTVCVGVLKNVTLHREQMLSSMVQITYRDGVVDNVPVVEEKDLSATQRQVTFYTNVTFHKDGYQVLETKDSTLTLTLSGADKIPTAFEGRSPIGHYFLVTAMTPH